MAYTKTVWETGDVITAAKLNNAEDGIEAANAVTFKYITATYADAAFTVSDTYANVKAAYLAGSIVFCNIVVSDTIMATCLATAYDDTYDCIYFANVGVGESGGYLQAYAFDATVFEAVTGNGGEG